MTSNRFVQTPPLPPVLHNLSVLDDTLKNQPSVKDKWIISNPPRIFTLCHFHFLIPNYFQKPSIFCFWQAPLLRSRKFVFPFIYTSERNVRRFFTPPRLSCWCHHGNLRSVWWNGVGWRNIGVFRIRRCNVLTFLIPNGVAFLVEPEKSKEIALKSEIWSEGTPHFTCSVMRSFENWVSLINQKVSSFRILWGFILFNAHFPYNSCLEAHPLSCGCSTINLWQVWNEKVIDVVARTGRTWPVAKILEGLSRL